jgi:hypothetical protein
MKVDLSTKEGFAIASALRGPDLPDCPIGCCAGSATHYDYLKYMTTGVIRHFTEVTYGIVISPGEAKEFWLVSETNESVKLAVATLWCIGRGYSELLHSGLEHFRTHILLAVQALNQEDATAYFEWWDKTTSDYYLANKEKNEGTQ